MSIRLRLRVRGRVQGVGFRPFVARLAGELGLSGQAVNDGEGACVEIEGPSPWPLVEALRHAPAPIGVEGLDVEELPPLGRPGFQLGGALPGARGLPPPLDRAVCDACLRELLDPADRRFLYPFISCASCGPRYPLLLGLPFERAATSMGSFPPCGRCQAERADPADRRYHAELVSCPACGPQLSLRSLDGAPLGEGQQAVSRAAARLAAGEIVAALGVGAYHLLGDACDAAAVERLRARKGRPHKPLAVLFPDVEGVRAVCELSALEEQALRAPEAPVVLLRRREHPPEGLAWGALTPGSPLVGALLPSTGIQHLLMREVARPLVCTSANLSGAPVLASPARARAELGRVADACLDHDLPLLRPVDDPVVREVGGRARLLRRGRGGAFEVLPLRGEGPVVLALGAHQSAALALCLPGGALLGPHIGDLSHPEALRRLEEQAVGLPDLVGVRVEGVACDLHPDYGSSRLAERLASEWAVPLVRVGHHHAHVAAVMAEHRLEGEVLGLAWDGAGLGEDGALWGGEGLVVQGSRAARVGHLRPFRLPGGEAAAREPRRVAVGLVHECMGEEGVERLARRWGEGEVRVWARMVQRPFNAPLTTSVGRLFDGVAALLGFSGRLTYQAQAAQWLEHLAAGEGDAALLPLPGGEGPHPIDWGPLIEAALSCRPGEEAWLAASLHASLAAAAQALVQRSGGGPVALAGGCFQNARLLTLVERRLRDCGARVYTPARVPPGDGGIALGQLHVARARLRGG